MLGADTKKYRTKDSISLIEYAYKNYEIKNIRNLVDKEFYSWTQKNLDKIELVKSNSNLKIKLNPISNYNIAIKKNNINDISINILSISKINSPAKQNDIIGILEVKLNDEIILSTEIVLDVDISRKRESEYVFEFFKNFNNYFNFYV